MPSTSTEAQKRRRDLASSCAWKNVFGGAICIAIGYLLGSTNNFASNAGGCSSMMTGERTRTKTASVANNTTVVHRGVDDVGSSANRNRNGTMAALVNEIVPPALRDAYNRGYLQFRISRNMLRKSRPVIGNTERLHTYLRKLRNGRNCTTVLFLGGSVTAGHNAGGPAKAYPKHFVDWLNEKYPCLHDDGRPGKHASKFTTADSSLSHFSTWSQVQHMETFDLVLIEFNVNDSFTGQGATRHAHALEDKGQYGMLSEYRSCWYFEVLLRRLLLMRKPDPPAIVVFNADYIGRIWAKPPYADPEEARKELLRRNYEPLKIWVSSLYEIPVVSAAIWMLPLAGKKGADWQFDRTNPYSTALWHADACCHPKSGGHLLLSLILAYCLLEEEKTMVSYNGHGTVEYERDFTMDDAPTLRDPLYLSPEEDGMYVRDDLPGVGYDFTDASEGEQQSWKDAIVSNEGWKWRADNRDNDKYGYIADGVSGGQHIAIALTTARHGRVEITYVVSYENFGVAIAWLDDSAVNLHDEDCRGYVYEPKDVGDNHLVAFWNDPASVPKVSVLGVGDSGLKLGTNGTLHICLTPRGEHPGRKGPENKFKLLGVRVY